MSRSKPATLFTPSGERIVLGRKLGQGGEGAVFAVRGATRFAVKVFARPATEELETKLRLMLGRGGEKLSRQAAWPMDLLHRGAPDGPLRGFLMPRVRGGVEIHRLYTVKDRRVAFRNCDWRFLGTVARNCAAVFEDIHAAGCCVGDVNQKNILVMPDATVRVLDCDSFQVHAADGRNFRCRVGVPEFTPPELQGTDFGHVTRTVEHDRFGLAVLIFHLLFVGRHPYAGVREDVQEQSLAAAIREGRFAYSRRRDVGVSPPPNVPTLDDIPDSLASLFERAFSGAGDLGPRPTAREWCQALGRFVDELRPCAGADLHFYHDVAPGCFWCDAERQGIRYFGEPLAPIDPESTHSIRGASRVPAASPPPPPTVKVPAPTPPSAPVRPPLPAPRSAHVTHGPFLRWDLRDALDGDYGIIGFMGGCVVFVLLASIMFLVAAGALYLNMGLVVLVEQVFQLGSPPKLAIFLLFFVSFPLSAAGGCYIVGRAINRHIMEFF